MKSSPTIMNEARSAPRWHQSTCILSLYLFYNELKTKIQTKSWSLCRQRQEVVNMWKGVDVVRDKELNWRTTNPHNTRHTRWNGGRGGYLMRRKWIGDERFVIGWGDSPGEQGYHTGIHVHFRYSCVVNSPEFTTQLYVQCGIPPGECIHLNR
jgi:hypothetical protein